MKQSPLCALALALSLAPAFAATFTVTTTADSGAGSLRQAILDANANPGEDTIQFNIPGEGVQTLAPLTALPKITSSVALNGYTQPGSNPNTLTTGSDAVLLIRLDGIKIPGGLPTALVFENASGSSVRGLVIVRFSTGIEIYNSSDVTIAGNWVGLDVDGIARGTTFDGITISCPVFGAATGNVIGGLAPADRNVISGNRNGVSLSPAPVANNFVLGNYIGTDQTGTLPRGNLFAGVRMQSAVNNTVGGPAPGAGNLLSACSGAGGSGVSILGGGGHLIQGNRIGTDVSGQYDLGNSSDGVFVQGASNVRVVANQIGNNRGRGVGFLGATSCQVEGNLIGTDASGNRPLGNALAGVGLTGSTNRVGGLAGGQANVIRFNGGPGIEVTSSTSTGNEISANSIYDNGGLGIDLGPSGGATNDLGDVDTGANGLQNFPELLSADLISGQTRVQGALNSAAFASFRLEFFASPAFDPTDTPEGRLFLGSLSVMTDGNGDVSFTALLPAAVPTNQFITATATDTSGNTSEFAAGIPVTPSAPRVSLQITPSGDASGGSTISWPATAPLFALETADSLAPTSQWHTVTSGVVDLGSFKSFSVSNTGEGQRFFRLKQP